MAEIILHGKFYEIPPLTTGQVRRNWANLAKLILNLDAGTDLDKLAGIGDLTGGKLDLLLIALRNEYPELTMDDLETLYLPELDQALIDLITASRLGKKTGVTAGPTESI